MILTHFILGLVLVAIVVDIVIRLVIASRRRERLIKDVLDTITETDVAPVMDAAGAPLHGLSIHLLRYFQQSTASRDVLAALAGESEALSEAALAGAVARYRRKHKKRELPDAAVLNAARILRGARLVEYRIDGVRITDAGCQLNSLIQRPCRLAPRHREVVAAAT